MENNQFITVTGLNTQRKYRINIDYIVQYNRDHNDRTVINILNKADVIASETPEEIDELINPPFNPYDECHP